MSTDDDNKYMLELQNALKVARVKLVDSSLALQDKSRTMVQWRSWYRRRPAYCLLGALALGLWLGRR